MSQSSLPEPTDEAAEGLTALGVRIGDRIGRYVIVSQLGVGAMGLVLAAYDPELDRKAALKLLKRRAEDRPKARKRLLREAQALAKLNHPNVVTVYDVGVHEQAVFIAMEFVAGRSLAAWMRPSRDGRPRPWSEVLAVFVAAGRGLLAVHEVGLVHRDFKPDNVMIGDDGRVLVADFGLARSIGESDHDEDARVGVELPVLHAKLTQTGASLGTPAYMAPEQFRGHGASIRSDQFSFGAALFEALYGVLPYPGKSRDRTIDPPAHVRVPAWLERVVRRALAIDPADRFSGMAELLAALEAGTSRRRRSFALAGVLTLGIAVAGGLGRVEHAEVEAEAACRATGDAIDRIWNAHTRTQLSEAVLATEVAYASTVVDKLTPLLDRRAEAWREHATLACTRATIEQRWDAATYMKARWCLDDHALELELLIDELSTADARMVEGAVAVAAGMSLVEACTDERSLASLPEPPRGEQRVIAGELHRGLLRATILERAGSYEPALELARASLTRAEALGWLPLTAALRLRTSSLLRELGDHEQARTQAEAAYLEAVQSDSWDLAAQAASRIAVMLGLHEQRPAEAKIWANYVAPSALTHAADPFQLTEARRLSHLAVVHWSAGEYSDGAALLQRALDMFVLVLGPEHPDVAGLLLNLGALQRALGHYPEAVAHYERALAVYEHSFGFEHPQVALCLGNLANALSDMGDEAAAQANRERALAIEQRSLGPEHAQTLKTLVNLASTYGSTGDPAEREALIRRALVGLEAALEPGDPKLSTVRVNLASALIELGRTDEAAQLLERTLAGLQAGVGLEHRAAGYVFETLGKLHEARGELEQALAQHERALAIRERWLAPDHPEVAEGVHNLGVVHERLGQRERARELFERALAIRAAAPVPPRELADTRFALARTLDAESRERARELVEQARATYQADAHAPEQLAATEQWLRSSAR